MKNTRIFLAICTLFALFIGVVSVSAQYKTGDKARDFSLKNIDGKMVSLKDFPSAKGFIVVFTCNHCPWSKLYEDRIIALDKKFRPLGYPVIAINPNDVSKEPDDSFDKMIVRAKEKGFTFPYLVDETQEIAKTYGATRTPHFFVLKKNGVENTVIFIGAMDDNAKEAAKVKEEYVAKAIFASEKGEKPNPDAVKAIGCTIKWKE